MTISIRLVVLLTLMAAPAVSLAAITRCEVESPRDIDPKWVMFDRETGRASIEWMGDVAQGRVVLETPAKPWGEKLNLVFPSTLAGSDPSSRMEIIVFPTSPTTHRMIGVVTKLVNGERYLYSGLTNVDVACTLTGM